MGEEKKKKLMFFHVKSGFYFISFKHLVFYNSYFQQNFMLKEKTNEVLLCYHCNSK